MMQHSDGGSVRVEAGRLLVDGVPEVVLCSSLFYFRLPPEQWRERLRLVRASGYRAVDVYFPWNFHELQPGTFDFSGARDIARFLDLAAGEDLLVMARPGPYICSEVDGGGLPAWLGLDPGLRVRQNEPRFLSQALAWYREVLPLIAERQHGNGGSVVLVQVENELDFFDCQDRTGYVEALADAARAAGITVPIIACAGQGDLAGATGNARGVVPAANFYPDDASPDVEAEVLAYQQELAARGIPLLITETNRRHLTLRRGLLSGARLLAPYLQSSGWNFDLNPSAGNWGNPGNLMTHSYDFGGYVAADGATRPEYAEGQRLAAVIGALGVRLAGAAPVLAAPLDLVPDFATSSVRPVLALDGGGFLAGLPNLSGTDGMLRLKTDAGATATALVPAGHCPLLLAGLPLAGWGVPAVLELATAELTASAAAPGVLHLTFAPAPGAVLVLSTDRDVTVLSGTAGRSGGFLVVDLAAGPGTVVFDDGTRLEWATSAAPTPGAVATPGAGVALSTGHILAARPFTGIPATRHAAAPPLEEIAVYAGRGRYRAAVPAGCRRLLIHGAADIVDLSHHGIPAGESVPLGTRVPYGAGMDVELPAAGGEVVADVEIWGHANFDDARLPALALGSLRGVGTVLAVTAATDVSALWRVHGQDQWAAPGGAVRRFGGWSSTRLGAGIEYRKTIPGPRAGEAWLHFAGLTAPVQVRVDGRPAVAVPAENPYLTLPAGADSWDVAVSLAHDPSAPSVAVTLLSGTPLRDWTVQALPQQHLDALALAAGTSAAGSAAEPLPLVVSPGQPVWLVPDTAALRPGHGYFLAAGGSGLMASVWLDGQRLGRFFPGGQEPGSALELRGGDPGVIWLPAPMIKPDARLTLLLECRGTSAGTLDSLLCRPAAS